MIIDVLCARRTWLASKRRLGCNSNSVGTNGEQGRVHPIPRLQHTPPPDAIHLRPSFNVPLMKILCMMGCPEQRHFCSWPHESDAKRTAVPLGGDRDWLVVVPSNSAASACEDRKSTRASTVLNIPPNPQSAQNALWTLFENCPIPNKLFASWLAADSIRDCMPPLVPRRACPSIPTRWS